MNQLIKNVLAPLSRRIGTAAAGALVGVVTLDPAIAERVELVVGAVILLAFDLVTSFLSRKSTGVA